jgi:anti-anti-sigma regulatory factor
VAIAELHTTDPSGFRVGLDADGSVLWLTGEHDAATSPGLRLMFVDLIALNELDITVDLSETLFVGTVVIGELERARHHLLARGRTLTVRYPSPVVRRTFTICNAAHLFSPVPSVSGPLISAVRDLTVTTL